MSQGRSYPVVLIKIPGNRNSEQKDLENERIHDLLNKPKLAKCLLSPYSRNIQSDFQGIFESGQHLIRHLFLIREFLYPIQPQFSIGIGQVDSTINKVAAVIIEGSALKQAQKGFIQDPKQSPALRIQGFTRTIDALLEPACELLWHSSDNWKLNRLKIFNAKLRGESEKRIAERLEISERAVYKNIREAHLNTWAKLIDALESNISKALRDSRQSS